MRYNCKCVSAEMGRRKGWFSAVKKALGAEHNEHGIQKPKKSKKKWFAKHQEQDPISMFGEAETVENAANTIEEQDISGVWNAEAAGDSPWCILEEPFTPPIVEQTKTSGFRIDVKDHHVHSVAKETPKAAQDAVITSPTAEEVVKLTHLTHFAEISKEEVAAEDVLKLTHLTHFTGKSKEEVAAIKIQAAFRGRRAKRALGALRGLVRLKALVQGSSIKRQTASTLLCMQTLSSVQTQILARRIRMSEENQALQRHLQQKHEKEIEKMKLTIDDWNGSTKSKDKLEESLRFREEAAIRRQRALAYAHSRQQKWRNATKNSNPTVVDEINLYWGWSWLERWMAARPWETSTLADNGGTTSALTVSEISKAYYAHRERHPDNADKPLPIPQRTSRISARSSPSTSASKTPTTPKSTKLQSSSNKNSNTKSTSTAQTGKQRRSSVTNSSTSKDKEKSLSISTMHSSRTSTMHDAQSRLQKSTSSLEKGPSAAASRSVNKRLSRPPSPVPSETRRHSGPPAVPSSSTKNKNSKP